jgi:hypothetical protein
MASIELKHGRMPEAVLANRSMAYQHQMGNN